MKLKSAAGPRCLECDGGIASHEWVELLGRRALWCRHCGDECCGVVLTRPSPRTVRAARWWNPVSHRLSGTPAVIVSLDAARARRVRWADVGQEPHRTVG
jgi:hypothetical protein